MVRLNFDAKEDVLDNGFKVITIKRETQLASLNLGIKIGALYEKENEKGISHFIEHMMFKGTKTRNNEKLNDDLEALGGEYNAYTDYTSTVYSITCLEEEIENAVDILSDMIVNPSFDIKEMKKERDVILSEIRTSKDDVEDLSFRRTSTFAFNESPLKYDIMGTEKSIASFSRKNLVEYYNKYYMPKNTVLTFVSSYDHDKAIELVKKYFDKWSNKIIGDKDFNLEKNIAGVFESHKNDIEQATITYLFSFNDVPKELELPIKILNHKLGESSNSILFRELREKRGFAYDVYTHLDLSSNVKTLHIFTSLVEENVEEAINVINECIEKIKSKDIVFDESTFDLMKKVHKTAVVSTLEDSTDLGNYVLHQILEGESMFEFIKDMHNLDSLKPEDIYKAAEYILREPTVHVLRS